MSTYRKRLDRLTSDSVCWMPYGDQHVVRDFELISLFFGHIQRGPVVCNVLMFLWIVFGENAIDYCFCA